MNKKAIQMTFDFGDTYTPKIIVEKQVALSFVNPTIPDIKKRGRPRKPNNPFELNIKLKRGRKKLDDIKNEITILHIPSDDILFQKQYYPIRVVAEMFNTTISQIREWEKFFDEIKPKKNIKGDRFFKPSDIKTLQLIHHLVREKKYTQMGAQAYLKQQKRAAQSQQIIHQLKELKIFLTNLKLNI